MMLAWSLIFSGVIVFCQTAKYEPTETESLQLQLAQAHAQLAQQQFNYAQENLSKAANEFNQTATKIVKAHGWPEDLRVDPNTLTFIELPKLPKAPIASDGEKPMTPAPAPGPKK